ncbi:MAG: acetolactate synthase 2 catalytic subunit [Chromatiales bacterium]|nr:acetolactate synthase 2 catalytic subunit [Chromatiales bacterium]
MNGAEYIIKALKAQGIDTLFGYPGGCIMPVYDALLGSGINHILCRHEQGAAFAANGYARSTGRVGVCLATSGPGATNLITAIADAQLDSVPLVAITGQVPTGLIGTDAFQELDVLGLSLSITKHSYLVEHIEQLPQIIEQAFQLATEGRPGPVLIDIPKDVQLAQIPESLPEARLDQQIAQTPNQEQISQALTMLRESKQPIIYAGGGITLADAVDEFRALVDTTQIPTVLTLKGLGNLPANHPLNLGMLGMHGSVAANNLVQQCDLLIAIGARFDDRVTGRLAQFAPHAKVIHLDIDPAEIGKLRQPGCALTGEIKTGMAALTIETHIAPWREQCQAEQAVNGYAQTKDPSSASAAEFLSALGELAEKDAIISCDVGQHQMWVAQYYPISHPRRHLSSGGLGAMGFGLPAAIGAQLANPQSQVISISGDGSFMMNVQELATISRYRLPIKMIILDNQALGMVRQQQELCYAKRYSEIDLSDNPAFTAVAEAFDIPAAMLNEDADLNKTLQAFLSIPGPALLHVPISTQENVWPMVKPGDSNEQMITGASA